MEQGAGVEWRVFEVFVSQLLDLQLLRVDTLIISRIWSTTLNLNVVCRTLLLPPKINMCSHLFYVYT